MHLKKYTIATFILMALVSGYVYTYVTKDTTTIDFFGIPLPSFSVALWVLVPLFILYIASMMHMSFYSLMGSLKLAKYEKDYEKIIEAITEAYLGKKSRAHTFKTERYKLLGTLLEKTTLFPSKEIIGLTNNEKIDRVLENIEAIKSGEVVELKEYNLSLENELVIQNERNRYKKDEITAEELLGDSAKYAEILKEEVYADYVKVASLSNIKKYKALLTKEALYNILARVNADDFTLEMSNEDLVWLINTLELSESDFVKLSSVISTSGMIPDQRMKLFEILSDEKDEAVAAYLYTLFDLEMLAPADEILDNSQPNEFMKFKAYRALKECQKNFSIELFI